VLVAASASTVSSSVASVLASISTSCGTSSDLVAPSAWRVAAFYAFLTLESPSRVATTTTAVPSSVATVLTSELAASPVVVASVPASATAVSAPLNMLLRAGPLGGLSYLCGMLLFRSGFLVLMPGDLRLLLSRCSAFFNSALFLGKLGAFLLRVVFGLGFFLFFKLVFWLRNLRSVIFLDILLLLGLIWLGNLLVLGHCVL
jgi:hypothetical protein